MRAAVGVPSLSTPSFLSSSPAFSRRFCIVPVFFCQHGFYDDKERHFSRKSLKYWDKFYRRHKSKFFKDRHYLEKDWGKYFLEDNDGGGRGVSANGKVVLEVGCGSGNTIFPLIAAYPKLFVYACDFSSDALALVKSDSKFNEDRIHLFNCDVTGDELCDKISPCSVDVVTLVFMLSAVSPNQMYFVLQNLKKVLKPNGHILVRDYAVGDSAQVKLENRNQIISHNHYFRLDGTCSFFFSEEFLSSLFSRAGYDIVDMNTYCRQHENRLKNMLFQRRWIRAIFKKSLTANLLLPAFGSGANLGRFSL